MKDIAVGIDFGTTNSLVSEWGNIRRHELSPFSFLDPRRRPHPSVVWFPTPNNAVVGLEAKNNLAKDKTPFGGNFFKSVKRRLGQNVEFSLDNGERIPAWKVASEVFKYLNNHYHENQNKYIEEAVVTVPVDYNGLGRKDVTRAMHAAGIRVNSFVHEPFAALISHYYSYEEKLSALRDRRVLVFDWGGGTLDLCIAEISDDGKRVYELANEGIADRAGDEFDHHIMGQMTERFTKEYQISGDFALKPHEKQRLLEECENRKIQLSEEDKVPLLLPDFCEINEVSRDLVSQIDREDFEKWISLEILAAEKCIDRILEKARLMPGQIDHVLMVGGTSSIPAVASMLESIFGSKVVMSHAPDKAISQGAAIVAAEGWKLYNVSDICIKLADDSYFPVLKSGTELSAKESSQYVFNCVDSRNGHAHLFFEKRNLKGDNDFSPLGSLSVPSSCPHPDFKNLDRIQAVFSVSPEGTLLCKALSSSEDKTVELEIHDLNTGMLLSE